MIINHNKGKEERDQLQATYNSMMLLDLIVLEADLKATLASPSIGQRRKEYIEMALDVVGDIIATKLYRLYL